MPKSPSACTTSQRRGLASDDQLESLRDISRLAANATAASRGPSALRSRAATPRTHSPCAASVAYAASLVKQTGRHSSRQPPSLPPPMRRRYFLVPFCHLPRPPPTALDLAERAADRVDRLLRRTAFACRELRLSPPLDGTWRTTPTMSRPAWNEPAPFAAAITSMASPAHNSPSPASPLLGPHVLGPPLLRMSRLSVARSRQHLGSKASTRWISDTGLARPRPHAGRLLDRISRWPSVLAVVSWGQRIIPSARLQNSSSNWRCSHRRHALRSPAAAHTSVHANPPLGPTGNP